MPPPGRVLPTAPHNLIVRFLRKGNQFPDSGRSHVAVQWSQDDPKQPFDNWFDSLFCEFVDEMLYWDF